MATLDEEFDALPEAPAAPVPAAKTLDEEFDELPEAPAAAPASTPKPMSLADQLGATTTWMGQEASKAGKAIGRSVAEAVPFAPQLLGLEEADIAKARKDSPVSTAATRAATTLGEYALAGRGGALGVGGLSALQEASALQREGKLDFSDPATYAKLAAAGVFGAVVPGLFKGADKLAKAIAPEAATPALASGVRRVGQALIRTATPAALAAPQVSTALSPETDTSGRLEAIANLGLLASAPLLAGRRGAARVGAERAASIAEQAEMQGKKVIGEREAIRGEKAIAEQAGKEAAGAIAERTEANRRARREVAFEQSVDLAADKLKGGAEKALAAVQTELTNQQQLLQALENATDPSLLGWRAKQFQDMANRLNSYEASWGREYPGQPLPPEFNDIRSKLDQSLMRNTQLMGSNATESFLADPDAKFAEYQARKVAEGRTKEADLLQRLNNALQFANKDFSAEARAQAAARKPQLDDTRRGSIYAKYGLADPGPQAPFASPVTAESLADVSRGISQAPMKKGELADIYRQQGLPSGMSEADILRAANVTPAEAARLLQEQRVAARNVAEFGTPTPTASTQRRMDLESTARALRETVVPSWLRGGVMLRGLGGRLLGSDVVPQTLPEYARWTSPTMSTEARMQTPFEAMEIAGAFERLLKADTAVDSNYRKFVERNPGATWLSYLRANPVVAAKVEAERQAAAEGAAP